MGKPESRGHPKALLSAHKEAGHSCHGAGAECGRRGKEELNGRAYGPEVN